MEAERRPIENQNRITLGTDGCLFGTSVLRAPPDRIGRPLPAWPPLSQARSATQRAVPPSCGRCFLALRDSAALF